MDKLLLESLQEELGVADAVRDTAFTISTRLMDFIGKYHRKKIANGVSTNVFKWSEPFQNKKINIRAENYYFSNKDVMSEYRKKFKKPGNRYDYQEKTLNIYTDFLNDTTNSWNLTGSIQHELEHMYQDFMKGDHISNTNLYKFGTEFFNSNYPDIKELAQAVYYSEDKEIYALANQCYRYLHDSVDYSDYGVYLKAAEQTPLYKAYINMKNTLQRLNNDMAAPKYNGLWKRLGVTREELFNRINIGHNKIIKYIGRAIAKAVKDKKESLESNGVHFEQTQPM